MRGRGAAFLPCSHEVAESILSDQGNVTQKRERRELVETLLLLPLGTRK